MIKKLELTDVIRYRRNIFKSFRCYAYDTFRELPSVYPARLSDCEGRTELLQVEPLRLILLIPLECQGSPLRAGD